MHLSFKLIGNDAIRQAIDHFLTMVCCNIFAFPNDANLKKNSAYRCKTLFFPLLFLPSPFQHKPISVRFVGEGV